MCVCVCEWVFTYIFNTLRPSAISLKARFSALSSRSTNCKNNGDGQSVKVPRYRE